jgi:hypothetical protein
MQPAEEGKSESSQVDQPKGSRRFVLDNGHDRGFGWRSITKSLARGMVAGGIKKRARPRAHPHTPTGRDEGESPERNGARWAIAAQHLVSRCVLTSVACML